MRFRLSNLTKENHRVELRYKSNDGRFDFAQPTYGDVVISLDGLTYNACLAGLAGPDFQCDGARVEALFTDCNNYPGLFYLNGTEYDFTGSGTFVEKALNYPDIGAHFNIFSSDGGNSLRFANLRPATAKIAFAPSEGQISTWKPNADNQNLSISNAANLLTFCLSPLLAYDLVVPSTAVVGESIAINLYLMDNSRVQLNSTNTKLEIISGGGDIVDTLFELDYASFSIGNLVAGELVIKVTCTEIVPESQQFTIDVSSNL